MARKTLAHVPPERFAAERDKAHVKNSEIAREMGVSPTRMTELTRTKGGSSAQFARMRDAVRGLRGKRRADRKVGGTDSSRSSRRLPSRSSQSLSPA